GSPEFVISMITFWKKYLEGPDSLIARPLVYKFIEALIPFTFHYEGCIQPGIIQLALDQITSLEQDLKQDANLPETVQGILKELKCFYEGGAKRDRRVDNVAIVICRRPAATIDDMVV
ncbi:hypothetical protein V496_03162, partial [Pseudogymnoascus sp. VKM F-4515 (FW-2607)]